MCTSCNWELSLCICSQANIHVQRLHALNVVEREGGKRAIECLHSGGEMSAFEFFEQNVRNRTLLEHSLAVCAFQMIRALAACGNMIHRNIQEMTSVQVMNVHITPSFLLCDFSKAIVLLPGEAVSEQDTHVPPDPQPPEWPTRFQHKAIDFWNLGCMLQRLLVKIGGSRFSTRSGGNRSSSAQISEHHRLLCEFLDDAIIALKTSDPEQRCANVAMLTRHWDSPTGIEAILQLEKAHQSIIGLHFKQISNYALRTHREENSKSSAADKAAANGFTLEKVSNVLSKNGSISRNSRRVIGTLGRLALHPHQNLPKLHKMLLLEDKVSIYYLHSL